MRTDVRAVLDRSKAFHALPDEQRRALADNLARVVAFLEDPALADHVRDRQEVRDLVGEVDFPAFVSGLVKGVFTSIVNSSIRQMEAYSKMLEGIAKTVDDFKAEATDDAPREGLARSRQQQLATMVLMGINRIVVTNGQINEKVVFDVKAHDSGDDDRK